MVGGTDLAPWSVTGDDDFGSVKDQRADKLDGDGCYDDVKIDSDYYGDYYCYYYCCWNCHCRSDDGWGICVLPHHYFSNANLSLLVEIFHDENDYSNDGCCCYDNHKKNCGGCSNYGSDNAGCDDDRYCYDDYDRHISEGCTVLSDGKTSF